MQNGITRVVSALIVSGLGSSAIAASYSVTDLGTLGGTSQAFSVSDSGIVVGISDNGSEIHGFRWQAGVMSDLGVLNASHHLSNANDVNNSGVAVGHSTTNDAEGFQARAVYWPGASALPLGSFGGGYGVARGINNQGDIVGISGYSTGVTHAFIWTAGTMTDLNVTGSSGDFSDAYDVNDARQVVGNTGDNIAFRWQAGVQTVLNPSAGSASSYAYQLNELGHAVGQSYTGAVNHPTFWISATPQSIDVLTGFARGINDADQIVGVDVAGPFLWDSMNGARNLNTLIDPLSGWTLAQAYDINNNGQIVGWGTNPSGFTHGFLLSPIPEPSLGLLGVGGLALGLRSRRSK